MTETNTLEAEKEKLVDFVLETTENPVDVWAVAATLESRGLRDVDAVQRYQVESDVQFPLDPAKIDSDTRLPLFDLAEDIYQRSRRRLRLQELTAFVLENTSPPLDRQAVLATLQNKRGLSDREAREKYGHDNLADLAEDIYQKAQQQLAETDIKLPVQLTRTERLLGHLGDLLQPAPLLIFLAAGLVLAYAFWAYFNAGPVYATNISLGVILSVLVTGGFSQAISRMGHFFTRYNYHLLARESSSRLIRRGWLAALLVGILVALVWVLIILLSIYAPQLSTVIIGEPFPSLAYYLLFSILWLLMAPLYTLRQPPASGGGHPRPMRAAMATVSAAFGGLLLLLFLVPRLYIVHWVGLLLVIGLAYWWWGKQREWLIHPVAEPGDSTFRGWTERVVEQKRQAVQAKKLPTPRLFLYALAPYLALILLYILYLLLARLNSWSWGQDYWPLTAWFRPSPEPMLILVLPLLAMAIFSLVALVTTILMLEKAIYEDKPILAIEAPERVGRFLRFYLRGTVFAVPMAVQVFSVIIFGFGLWASMDFSEEAATTVALGTILCFVVTGGFMQSIGRLGQYYREQRMHILVRQIAYRIMRNGIITMLGVGALWYVVNLFMPYFPQRVILVSLAYYFLLSSLWLFLAVLYTLQKRVAIVMIVIIGLVVIGLVLYVFTPWGNAYPLAWGTVGFLNFIANWAPAWLARIVFWIIATLYAIANWLGVFYPYRGPTWNIYAAHWIGLAVAGLVAFLWGHRKLFWPAFRLAEEPGSEAAQRRRAILPRASILTYAVSPYFVYGTLYFAFLFLDRVISWSAGEEPLPLLIWFRTPYELGLDWALLSMLLTIAMLEYTVHEFGSVIVPVQTQRKALQLKYQAKKEKRHRENKERTPLDKQTVLTHPLNPDAEIEVTRQFKSHNNYFFRFYLRQVLLLVCVSVVSILVTYYGVLWLRRFDDVKAVRDFFANPITFWVFYISVIGYAFLVWGMLNSVFSFFLSRPWLTIRTIAIAFVINLIIGYILSRMVAYWYGAVGMTVGALVFAIMMTWYTFKVFRNLDYYYYSAY